MRQMLNPCIRRGRPHTHIPDRFTRHPQALLLDQRPYLRIARQVAEQFIRCGLRRWDADARLSSSLPTEADGLPPDDHRVRWMLLGLLFETQAEAWYLVSRLRERRRRALRRRMEALRPITEWLPAGLVCRLEELRAQGQARGERWRRGGYLAEQEGRRLARYAA